MTDTIVTCPHCGVESKAPSKYARHHAMCPACGNDVNIPPDAPAPTPPAPIAFSTTQSPPLKPENVQKVAVTDVDIPFTSMVVLLLKWALAAIPAMMICGVVLMFIWLIIAVVFMGGCAALLTQC